MTPWHTPRAARGLLWGVDLSNRQKAVTVPRLADAGCSFAMHKASEGESFVDAYYHERMAQLGAAAVFRTGYHFSRPGSNLGKQAARFVELYAPYAHLPGTLPPVIDAETDDGRTPSYAAGFHLDLAGLVEAGTGRRPILYTFDNYARTRFTLPAAATFPLWVAAYRRIFGVKFPGAWSRAGWQFWQHTSSATVPGVAGRVDRSVYRGTPAQLSQLAGIYVPTSSPAPVRPAPVPVASVPVAPCADCPCKPHGSTG